MRLGFAPIRGSNPRASATDQALCSVGRMAVVNSVIILASWANDRRLRFCDLDGLLGHVSEEIDGRPKSEHTVPAATGHLAQHS